MAGKTVVAQILRSLEPDDLPESALGSVSAVSGPVVTGERLKGCAMHELVRVGAAGLVGEVIRLCGDTAVVQVYEETSGLMVGDPIVRLGQPLSVELGPGLLGTLFDGVQRPLRAISAASNSIYIPRGIDIPALDRHREYDFEPRVRSGDAVHGGDILGTVHESELLASHVLVPPGVAGRLRAVAPAGRYDITAVIAELETPSGTVPLRMYHSWPARVPRPVADAEPVSTPLFTGQRVLDTLFPAAQGGTVAVPGAFGCGKTVISHALAKHSNSDVVVYVGCGERGNEISEILRDFAALRVGEASAMARTVLVANTSNMPVAAREASVYTGATIAEYFRDQGLHAALMADSTSRWAEALREISGRLAEMPADCGFPAYLSGRLAGFYERAGAVRCLGSPTRRGSVTIVGAVSPPGGDFADPVTAATLGLVQVFWGLDKRLAQRKHFPAIDVARSYSRCAPQLLAAADAGTVADRQQCAALLSHDAELAETIQLVGRDALSESDRLCASVARLVREHFLQQDGCSPHDACSPRAKTTRMLANMMSFYRRAAALIAGGQSCDAVLAAHAELWQALARMKFHSASEDAYFVEIERQVAAMGGE